MEIKIGKEYMIKMINKSMALLFLINFSTVSASMVDLMYLPEYGKFQVNLGYTYDNLSYSNRSSTSRINTFEQTNNESIVNTSVSYSPFNEVQIGIGFDYLISSTFEQKPTDGTETIKIEKTGLKEPYFFTHFRMIKEEAFGFDIDGELKLAPSFSAAEEEDKSKETSAKRGGGLYSGSLIVGKRMDDFAFKGFLLVDYYGEQEIENTKTGLKTSKYDSRLDFSVGVISQLRFSELHGIEVGLEYKTVGDAKEIQTLSSNEIKEDSYSCIILNAGYKGEFVENLLMGYFDFAYHKISDHNINTGDSITENIDNDKKVWSTGLTFKF